MTTVRQDREFAEAMLPLRSLLDDSITWMGDNLEPYDVFSEKQLTDWALANGFEEVKP